MTRASIATRLLFRCALLAIGFAATTFGLIQWQALGFSFRGVMPFDAGFRLHPLHYLIVGIAMIPPSLWEIFLLEQERRQT
jgi:hypothetical protein